MFIKEDFGRDGYAKVTNIYRDGVKIDTPRLDNEFHEYQFDSGFQYTIIKTDIIWTRYTFRAKITEFSQKIEE